MAIKRPYNTKTILYGPNDVATWSRMKFGERDVTINGTRYGYYTYKGRTYREPHNNTERSSFKDPNGNTYPYLAINKYWKNRSIRVSPEQYEPNQEVQHVQLRISTLDNNAAKVSFIHAAKPDFFHNAAVTYWYVYGHNARMPDRDYEQPMPYGSRNAVWMVVDEEDAERITSFQFSYWEELPGITQHYTQEGPFFTTLDNEQIAYFIGYPANYDSEKARTYPLIISAAGSDTVGNDGKRGRSQVEPGFVIRRHRKNFLDFPHFNIVLQTPRHPSNMARYDRDQAITDNANYHDGWNNTYGEDSFACRAVEHIIEKFTQDPDFKIDTSRIYMTGFSGGAKLTFEFIKRRPDMIAAAVPIAGWPIYRAYSDPSTSWAWDDPAKLTAGWTDTIKTRLRKERLRSRTVPLVMACGHADNMRLSCPYMAEAAIGMGAAETRYVEVVGSHGASPKSFWNDRTNVEWLFSHRINNHYVPDAYPEAQYNNIALTAPVPEPTDPINLPGKHEVRQFGDEYPNFPTVSVLASDTTEPWNLWTADSLLSDAPMPCLLKLNGYNWADLSEQDRDEIAHTIGTVKRVRSNQQVGVLQMGQPIYDAIDISRDREAIERKAARQCYDRLSTGRFHSRGVMDLTHFAAADLQHRTTYGWLGYARATVNWMRRYQKPVVAVLSPYYASTHPTLTGLVEENLWQEMLRFTAHECDATWIDFGFGHNVPDFYIDAAYRAQNLEY